jgi:hypothetical protein
MKLLQSMATAAVAVVSMSIPALATVDSGTPQLLQTLTEYGVTIEYNPPGCGQGWAGRYSTDKVMSLCYSGKPNADAHDTVRHETAHFLQHCATMRRGGRGITPLAINPTERTQWVSSVLRRGHINQIKSLYPSKVHQIELEAFAMAAHYDANQLASLVKSWCTK